MQTWGRARKDRGRGAGAEVDTREQGKDRSTGAEVGTGRGGSERRHGWAYGTDSMAGSKRRLVRGGEGESKQGAGKQLYTRRDRVAKAT